MPTRTLTWATRRSRRPDHAAERYVTGQYDVVPGMSSQISAETAVALLRVQSRHGLYGDVAEIGVFEGRFLIPLALCLQPGERALGIDPCRWPDSGVEGRLRGHLQRTGVAHRIDLWISRSTDIALKQGGHASEAPGPMRFVHVDGEHTSDAVLHDLRLSMEWAAPWAVICLDDMLSPAYPALSSSVMGELEANADWRLFCVVDRERIYQAAKFFICRIEYFDLYAESLAATFPKQIWPMGAEMPGYRALVLSRDVSLPRWKVETADEGS